MEHARHHHGARGVGGILLSQTNQMMLFLSRKLPITTVAHKRMTVILLKSTLVETDVEVSSMNSQSIR